MPNESTKKTILVAVAVCLVCSILVSTAAVTLKGLQTRNRAFDKLKNILDAGGIPTEKSNLLTVYRERIRPVILDVERGVFINQTDVAPELEPDNFDIKAIVNHPEYSRPLTAEEDMAQIRRIPRMMVVYQVMGGDSVSRYILPVFGKGLWSTMYGLLALSADLRTIEGFTFYEHGETPGLGGEVDNPVWKKSWIGKVAYDESGEVIIRVLKGRVDPSSREASHCIDGLSGSTLTTRGVDRTVRFWLGDHGYGPLIKHLKGEG
jgi:Na+-transporting NADH:ubiquinone oxidoreductase subunit C